VVDVLQNSATALREMLLPILTAYDASSGTSLQISACALVCVLRQAVVHSDSVVNVQVGIRGHAK